MKLQGLKLCGLRQNQISTSNYIYQNDQHEKIYTFGDLRRETPTHKAGAHAISKFWVIKKSNSQGMGPKY